MSPNKNIVDILNDFNTYLSDLILKKVYKFENLIILLFFIGIFIFGAFKFGLGNIIMLLLILSTICYLIVTLFLSILILIQVIRGKLTINRNKIILFSLLGIIMFLMDFIVFDLDGMTKLYNDFRGLIIKAVLGLLGLLILRIIIIKTVANSG